MCEIRGYMVVFSIGFGLYCDLLYAVCFNPDLSVCTFVILEPGKFYDYMQTTLSCANYNAMKSHTESGNRRTQGRENDYYSTDHEYQKG